MIRAPPRVFLSYARQDGEAFATALRRRLEAEQPEITLWQDPANLEGGADWWAQIEKALDHVKFLVIVMTPGVLTAGARRNSQNPAPKMRRRFKVRSTADARRRRPRCRRTAANRTSSRC
jgi:hypothetical protein